MNRVISFVFHSVEYWPSVVFVRTLLQSVPIFAGRPLFSVGKSLLGFLCVVVRKRFCSRTLHFQKGHGLYSSLKEEFSFTNTLQGPSTCRNTGEMLVRVIKIICVVILSLMSYKCSCSTI